MLLHYFVKYQCSKNCNAQDLSKLLCKTQPLKTVVKNSLQWFYHYLGLVHWLKDIYSGHTKISIVWLYTLHIYCDTEEKILQQNAFVRDVWSVSHFLPVSSPNVHRLKKLFTSKLINKSVVKWLLYNPPPHLKHVATLPCDLSLITMHASDFR